MANKRCSWAMIIMIWTLKRTLFAQNDPGGKGLNPPPPPPKRLFTLLKPNPSGVKPSSPPPNDNPGPATETSRLKMYLTSIFA